MRCVQRSRKAHMAIVLILDDEAVNRYLVTTVLTHAGHRVIEADDGATAIGLVRTERPDLVIVDLFMPRMSGTEFIRALRNDSDLANTRVALYTGSAPDDALRDFMTMTRIEHVIPKPSEPDELALIVARACAATP